MYLHIETHGPEHSIDALQHTTPFANNRRCWNVEKCSIALCCNSLCKHCLWQENYNHFNIVDKYVHYIYY